MNQEHDTLNCVNSKPCMDCENPVNETKRLQANNKRLFTIVQDNVDQETMELICELIENEILLEQECNQ